MTKILAPVAVIAFVISGLLILTEGIYFLVKGTHAWAYSINLIAVCLIILGLAFALVVYAFLFKPGFGQKKPNAEAASTEEPQKVAK